MNYKKWNKLQNKFPRKNLISTQINSQKKFFNQLRKCGNVATTWTEHVCVNWNNTDTNVPRKMSEIFSVWKFLKWRTSKFWEKYLKTKTKISFTGQGIKHVNVAPPECKTGCRGPRQHVIPLNSLKKFQNQSSLKTQKYLHKMAEKENWELLAVSNEFNSLIVRGINAKIVSLWTQKKCSTYVSNLLCNGRGV